MKRNGARLVGKHHERICDLEESLGKLWDRDEQSSSDACETLIRLAASASDFAEFHATLPHDLHEGTHQLLSI